MGIENEVSISPHVLYGNHKPHFQPHIMGIIRRPNPKYMRLETLKLEIGQLQEVKCVKHDGYYRIILDV